MNNDQWKNLKRRFASLMFTGTDRINEPVEIGPWPERWVPFGNNGDMMKQLTMGIDDGADVYAFKSNGKDSELVHHRHRYMENIIVVRGSMTLTVELNPPNVETFLLSEGETFTVPPMTFHGYVFHQPTMVLFVHIPGGPMPNTTQFPKSQNHNYEK